MEIINKKNTKSDSILMPFSAPNYSELNNEINQKYDVAITELISEDANISDDAVQNNNDKIVIFLSDYDSIKLIMSTDQLYNFYKTVEKDIPDLYFIESGSLSYLQFENSHALLITNNEHEIASDLKYPNLNELSFNSGRTIRLSIIPKTKNYKDKYIFRQIIEVSRI